LKQYKAILIDWDQTIGDWVGAEELALRDLYENYHLSEWFTSFEEYFAIYRERNLELWTLYGEGKVTREALHHERFLYPLLKILNLSFTPKRFDELADKMGEDFLTLTNKYFRLLPGAKEVVIELSKRYPLTIVSNGFSEVQYYKFEHSGLKPYLKHIVLSEEVGINKPQPEIFEKALEMNGVTADEAIMIGDSWTHDIVGAKNAGIDTIWVKGEKSKVESQKSKDGEETATYEVTSLAEVLEIL